MADESPRTILEQGVTAWNKWRNKSVNTQVKLFEVRLAGANLSEPVIRASA
jgi:hypothetical protein